MSFQYVLQRRCCRGRRRQQRFVTAAAGVRHCVMILHKRCQCDCLGSIGSFRRRQRRCRLAQELLESIGDLRCSGELVQRVQMQHGDGMQLQKRFQMFPRVRMINPCVSCPTIVGGGASRRRSSRVVGRRRRRCRQPQTALQGMSFGFTDSGGRFVPTDDQCRNRHVVADGISSFLRRASSR